MKTAGLFIVAAALMAAAIAVTPVRAQTQEPEKPAIEVAPVTSLKLMAITLPEKKAAVQLELPPRRQIDKPHKLVRLLDHAAAGDSFDAAENCSRDALGRPELLCGVRWRKSDALSDLRAEYSRVNRGVKKRVFGQLARHIDLDLDSSPKIQFKFEFD